MQKVCAGVIVVVMGMSAFAHAQCSPGWLAGAGLAGVDGDVLASVVWDSDGAGPATPKLVVAGLFNLAGSTLASNIAVWDPATSQWSAMGPGLNDQVDALTVMANGDLIAGGKFTQAGGASLNHIARWNGTVWSAIGTGTDNEVRGLFTMPNGDLMAGGTFVHAGGVAATRVARWNGSIWSAMGSGFGADVLAFTIWNGDLIAGGVFSGGAGNRVSRWTGTSWQPLGAGLNAAATSFVTLANGDLAVGGIFGMAGGSQIWGVAAWNGTTWTQLGAGLNDNQVSRIIRDVNGDLLAAGYFSLNGSGVARWNGTAWSGIGAAASGGSKTLAVFPDGTLYMGGTFEVANSQRANGVARLDAGVWKALSPDVGPSGMVLGFGLLNNGKVIVSGNFDSVAGLPNTKCHAVWNGSGWEALTTGANSGYAYSFDKLPNGDLIASGVFTTIGGVSANRIARWNGTAWSPLGSGIPSGVSYVVKVLSNGDVVVGGSFPSVGGAPGTKCLAKWNGSAWSSLGPAPFTGQFDSIAAIAELPNGDVLVGGNFDTAGGVPAPNIARWNGTSWSSVGAGLSASGGVVGAILPLPDGDVIVAGYFTSSGALVLNDVARWNGVAWSDMSAGLGAQPGVDHLVIAPNGQIIAGGYFAIGLDASRGSLAAWNGISWEKFGGGTGGLSQEVAVLASGPSQELLVGGGFTLVDNAVSAYFARYKFGLPLSITAEPLDVALLPGQIATFDVGATADPSNVFAWRKDGSPLSNGGRISGANTATLQISAVGDLDQGAYSCAVSGNCGSAISDAAALSCKPVIVQQPPALVALKRAKQLSFQVPSGAPYTYQWRRDSMNLSNMAGVLAGATTRTLTFLAPDLSLWGVYDCVATDACGTATTLLVHVCLGDLDANALIDDVDFVQFVSAYDVLLCSENAMPAGCPADFNNDSVVDDVDFGLFAQAYDMLLCP
ncbi:MAG: immunoglobulin domain-containing protein [Phycisphaerales bacterium]